MSYRQQGQQLFTAIAVLIGILVIVQLWLLGVSLDGVLGGDPASAIAAAIASLVLLGVNGGLLLYVRAFDRRTRS
jgi:hypothetical protein